MLKTTASLTIQGGTLILWTCQMPNFNSYTIVNRGESPLLTIGYTASLFPAVKKACISFKFLNTAKPDLCAKWHVLQQCDYLLQRAMGQIPVELWKTSLSWSNSRWSWDIFYHKFMRDRQHQTQKWYLERVQISFPETKITMTVKIKKEIVYQSQRLKWRPFSKKILSTTNGKQDNV